MHLCCSRGCHSHQDCTGCGNEGQWGIVPDGSNAPLIAKKDAAAAMSARNRKCERSIGEEDRLLRRCFRERRHFSFHCFAGLQPAELLIRSGALEENASGVWQFSWRCADGQSPLAVRFPLSFRRPFDTTRITTAVTWINHLLTDTKAKIRWATKIPLIPFSAMFPRREAAPRN